MKKRVPETSIIIVTLNEEKNLPKLLSSIKHQKYKNYEIIVSDAGSKDKTVRIAKKFRCRIAKGGLPARGRNNGAKVAKGRYLIFFDSDILIPTGFLENILRQVKEENIDIASVSQIPVTKNKTEVLFHKFYNFWQKAMERIDPYASGACIIIKKSIFRKVGGFDETIKLAEDHALARKARKSGAKYRVLNEKIFISTRRMKKDGSAVIAVKFVLAAVHRMFLGEIRTDIFKYKFGHY